MSVWWYLFIDLFYFWTLNFVSSELFAKGGCGVDIYPFKSFYSNQQQQKSLICEIWAI